MATKPTSTLQTKNNFGFEVFCVHQWCFYDTHVFFAYLKNEPAELEKWLWTMQMTK